MNAGSIVAHVKAKIDELKAGISQAKDELKGFQNHAREQGKKMVDTGKTLTKYVTAPIIAIGTMAIKTAATFEQGMNKVRAITGATGETFDRLRAIAMEMGRTTKFTATESADALGFLGMAGFSAEESISALPGVLQLAAAANMDLATTADYASNILTGFALDVSELGRVNDVLAKTFTSSNTNMSQLAEAMKYVGPVAAGMGMTIEETAAAIGMLGDAGIQGSMAGTTLRQSMIQLMAGGGRAAETIERLGLVTEDSTGQFIGMVSIIEQLEESGASTADMLQLFGARGAGMIAMVSQGSEKFKDFIVDLENAGGTAEYIAEVQMEGLMGQWTKMKSALESFMIVLGDQLLPMATVLIEKVTEWFQALSSLDDGTLKLILTVAGLVAAIGPLLMIYGKLIMAKASLTTAMFIAKGGLAAMAGAAPAAAAGLGTVGTTAATAGIAAGGFGAKLAALAVAGGPILAVVAVLGILAFYVSEYAKAMSFDFRSLAEVASESFDNILEFMANSGVDRLKLQTEQNLESIAAQLEYYMEKEQLTKEEEAKQTELIEQMQAEIAYLEQVNLAQRLLQSQIFHEEMGEMGRKSNEELVELAQNRAAEVLKELETETEGVIAEIIDRHARAGTVESAEFQQEIEDARSHFINRREVISEELGKELSIYEDALAERGLAYSVELGRIVTLEELHHKEMQEKYKTAAGEMEEAGAGYGRAQWQGVLRGMKEGEEPVNQAADQLHGNLQGPFSDTYDEGKDAGDDFADGLVDGIDDGKGPVETASRNLSRGAITAARREVGAQSPARVFFDLGRDMVQGMINGIQSLASRVMQVARTMVQNAVMAVKQALQSFSPSKVMINIGASIPEGLTIGIEDMGQKAVDAVQNMMNQITGPGISDLAMAGAGGGGMFAGQVVQSARPGPAAENQIHLHIGQLIADRRAYRELGKQIREAMEGEGIRTAGGGKR